jgi:hypothetical protein
MADSDALRMQRSRRHRAGDHSLCKRCAAVRMVTVADPPVEDPVAVMRQLAGQLAAACRADPGNATLARELRMTLQALADPGDGLDGELREFLAGFSRA